jgi:hypothetical protein
MIWSTRILSCSYDRRALIDLADAWTRTPGAGHIACFNV